jgi:hypothetical protein
MKTRYKHGGKNRKNHGGKFRKKEYGIGGAVMTLGKNLLQGKKFGSGALKGVLRAGITPGSGVGAGIGLAGAGLSKIGEKTGREGLQKLGKGVGMAGNIAGMFTGGGGGAGEGLSNIAGGGGGGGLANLASKFTGGGGGGGNPLFSLAKNFIPGMTPAADGMKVPYAYGGKMRVMKEGGLVGGQKNLDKNNDGEITGEDFKMLRSMMGGGKMYEDGGEVEPLTDEENGGEVEPLTNKEFRENEKFQRQADKQRRPYERSRDVEKLLGKLENNEKVDERAQILRQLVRILGIAGTGILGTTLAGDKLGVGERGWQRIGDLGGDPI